MQVAGNAFLVTGGASGLGAASARRLIEAGASVVLADLNNEAGNEAASSLGERARFCQADVTSEEQVAAAIELAGSVFGGFRGVVHCAGIEHAERVVGRSGAHSLEAFARVIQVNLIGTFNVVRLAAEALAKSEPTGSDERGVLVLTASIAAYDGQIGQAGYAASKGGVAAMTLPLARDLARFGIRVMTIAPGVFDTPLVARLPESVRASLAANVPFPPRLGRPEEFAALALHVLENEMLNGAVIRLDGALRMSAK